MSGALRRVALVALAYAAGGWLVISLAGWLRPVLALPPIFDRIVRGALIVGAAVALLMAWHYPSLGHDGAAPDGERDAR